MSEEKLQLGAGGWQGIADAAKRRAGRIHEAQAAAYRGGTSGHPREAEYVSPADFREYAESVLYDGGEAEGPLPGYHALIDAAVQLDQANAENLALRRELADIRGKYENARDEMTQIVMRLGTTNLREQEELRAQHRCEIRHLTTELTETKAQIRSLLSLVKRANDGWVGL